MPAEETSSPDSSDAEKTPAVVQLRAAGLYELQIVRLIHLKAQHATGAVSELTREYKYLEFGKYLVDSHGLHEYV